MKYLVLSILLLFTVSSPAIGQERTELQEPSEVAFRREAARSKMLSFNKRELALAGDVTKSTYIQPLIGEWKAKLFTSPTSIDTLLTAPDLDLSSWESVTLPEKTNSAWAAIYRHDFKMPFAWIDRAVFVQMGPVNRAYYLYVNGLLVGYNEDSKNSAYFDVTKYVVDGKNHLAVIAYANPISTTLENQIPETGTAISGDIYIMSQPKVRIRDYVVDTRFDPSFTSGLLNLGVIVKSHLLNPKEVTVYYDLLSSDSTVVASGYRDARFNLRGEDTVRFFSNIPNIASWSEESPVLYTLLLRLQHEGRYTEYITKQIGFRQVELTPEGLKINGMLTEIRAIDYSVPKLKDQIVSDLISFKRSGINLLRIENFPQADYFYELCDKAGIYVCDQANIDSNLSGVSREIGGSPANDPVWELAHSDRVMSMYQTSKNHPSVVMFSTGRKAGQGYNMYEAYLRLKEVESDRPIVYEGAGAEWNTDIIIDRSVQRNSIDKRQLLTFERPSFWNETPESQPLITFEAVDLDKRVFKVSNRHRIANLNNYKVEYRLLWGKREIASGVLTPSAAPQSSEMFPVPLEGVKPGKYTLKLVATPKHIQSTSNVTASAAITFDAQIVIPKPPKIK